MEKINFQHVIGLLEQVRSQPEGEIDYERIDKAIDELETLKGNLNPEQEEAIDMIDEVQDFLEYLLNSEDTLEADELKAEITDMIDDLRRLSR